jgi:signal transduction histidine kinase
VLALLVVLQELVLLRAVLAGLPSGVLPAAAAEAGGVVLLLVQAGLLFARRSHPRLAFTALVLLTPLHAVLVGAVSIYPWIVLAFAVTRAPPRGPLGGAGILVAGWLGALVASFMAVVLFVTADPLTTLMLVVVLLLVDGMLVLAAGVAGRIGRAVQARDERRRASHERSRHAAALSAERARIAEEIGGGVLTDLRALVAQVEVLDARDTAALRAVREQASTILAAMRRVLTVLRAPVASALPDPGPAPVPGRFDRWLPPSPDGLGLFAVLAVALTASLADLATSPDGSAQAQSERLLLDLPMDDPLTLLPVLGQVLVLGWWRRAPLSAVLLGGLGVLAAALLGATNAFVDLSWLLLVWGAATGAPPRRSAAAVAVAGALVLAASDWSASLLGQGRIDDPVSLVSFTLVPGLWLAGVLVRRHRGELADQARQRADARAHRALAAERLRVARELHDVVAHHVSAVAVQAGAAGLVDDPDVITESQAHIRESGRRIADALPELADLNPDVGEAAALTAARVEQLVAPVRSAGLPVRTELVGEPADPPGEAELFAQRILGEALTNTLRYAGPTPTTVRIEHRSDAVLVTVHDDGPVPGHRPGTRGSGLGLVGTRERAALRGGTARIGPFGAGWEVHVVLPRTVVTEGLLLEEERQAPEISSATTTRPRTPGS